MRNSELWLLLYPAKIDKKHWLACESPSNSYHKSLNYLFLIIISSFKVPSTIVRKHLSHFSAIKTFSFALSTNSRLMIVSVVWDRNRSNWAESLRATNISRNESIAAPLIFDLRLLMWGRKTAKTSPIRFPKTSSRSWATSFIWKQKIKTRGYVCGPDSGMYWLDLYVPL